MNDNIKTNNYFEFRNITSDTYYEHSPFLPSWIAQEISKDDVILDYGCGFGQMLYALSKNGYKHIFGVDIEKNAIKSCCEKNLQVKALDLNDLKNPFNFKFDIIILSHVIEHINKNQIIATLSFIKEHFLKHNGKLLVAVPNAQSNTDCYWAYEDWTHSTLFTSGSLYFVLKSAGFNSVEFLDIDGTLDMKCKIKIFIKKALLKLYIANKNFWNLITSSSYHKPSQQIFSYEIKCKAY